MLSKELYPIANQKSLSNLHLKLSNIFNLRMCFLQNSALESFIILSVIAAWLFTMAKQNAIFMSEQLNIAAEQNKAILNKMIKSLPLELFEHSDCVFFNKNGSNILNVTVISYEYVLMKRGKSSI